jgi:hypothetical protein
LRTDFCDSTLLALASAILQVTQIVEPIFPAFSLIPLLPSYLICSKSRPLLALTFGSDGSHTPWLLWFDIYPLLLISLLA